MSDDPHLGESLKQLVEEAEARGKEQAEQSLLPKQALKDRITVAGYVYHQPPPGSGGQVTSIKLNFQRLLKSEPEQVFSRWVRNVGPDWQPLIPKGCWIQPENMGMVVVRSDNDRTEEDCTLHITLDKLVAIGGRLLIFTGETQHITVLYPEQLYICAPDAEGDKAKYTIYVFPR